MSELTQITSVDEFDTLIAGETPVLVDFYADWCGPCQAMMPVVENAMSELGDKAKVVKVNIDDLGELAQRYGVMSIPTFKVFKGNEEVLSHTGSSSMEDLIAMATA